MDLPLNILRPLILFAMMMGGVGPVFSETFSQSQPGIHIVSTPPTLSIEARGATLPNVLKSIGTYLGFKVVDIQVNPRTPIDFTIQNVSLDEVLRQLLVGENYAISPPTHNVKKSQAAHNIGTIFLSGPRPTEDERLQLKEQYRSKPVQPFSTKALQEREVPTTGSFSPVFGMAPRQQPAHRPAKNDEVSRRKSLGGASLGSIPRVPPGLTQQALGRVQALKQSLEQLKQQMESGGRLP